MSRLNKTTREYIVQQAIAKSGIPEALAGIQNSLYNWADRLRVHTNGMSDEGLDKLEADFQALNERVPKDLRTSRVLVPKTYYFCPILGGMAIGEHHFSANHDDLRPAIRRPSIGSDHPLAVEWHELNDRAAQLRSDRKVLEAQVWSVVNNVPTIQKLLQVWPESRELLPSNEQPIISNVPAVLVSSLNAAIGLPSEEDAE